MTDQTRRAQPEIEEKGAYLREWASGTDTEKPYGLSQINIIIYGGIDKMTHSSGWILQLNRFLGIAGWVRSAVIQIEWLNYYYV